MTILELRPKQAAASSSPARGERAGTTTVNRRSTGGEGRLTFLDWSRGLAAMIMLQGHVFHSFTRTDLRDSGPYVMSQFFGGMAPATFLFLTGVTLAFLMASSERKGLTLMERWTAALRRSGYLFALAFAFRVQMWIFGLPNVTWRDLLKVDILNAMGFAMLVLSPLALVSIEQRAKLAALVGAAIAFLGPVVSAADWSAFPQLLSAYWVPNYNFFAFFPWGAFIAFGVAGGSVLKIVPAMERGKLMQWGALAGLWLLVGAKFAADLPYSMYAKSEYWLDSPWLVVSKLACVLVVIPVAYLWSNMRKPGWSFLEQLGTTSLLIYWVHIELVYGRWFAGFKESLGIGIVVVIAAIVIALMVGLSLARTRWHSVIRPAISRKMPRFADTFGFYVPERVPGD